MRKLLFLVVLISTPAWADYTLTLTPQELSYIGALLGKQPYADVNALLTKIGKQVDEQNAKAALPPEPPKAPDAVSK